ncbi:hypothetical protein NGM07_17915 [Halorussus vallis]|nr:hypothetical protein [Halorussus vallis]USZ75296.1 hypothetical protein NGM07_17915 [Halorussus vallis]
MTPRDPEKVGEFRFVFGDDPRMFVHVFRAERFSGTPEESEEADPEWFDYDAVPCDGMWEDDRYWIPYLFDGETFAGEFSSIQLARSWSSGTWRPVCLCESFGHRKTMRLVERRCFESLDNLRCDSHNSTGQLHGFRSPNPVQREQKCVNDDDSENHRQESPTYVLRENPRRVRRHTG